MEIKTWTLSCGTSIHTHTNTFDTVACLGWLHSPLLFSLLHTGRFLCLFVVDSSEWRGQEFERRRSWARERGGVASNWSNKWSKAQHTNRRVDDVKHWYIERERENILGNGNKKEKTINSILLTFLCGERERERHASFWGRKTVCRDSSHVASCLCVCVTSLSEWSERFVINWYEYDTHTGTRSNTHSVTSSKVFGSHTSEFSRNWD